MDQEIPHEMYLHLHVSFNVEVNLYIFVVHQMSSLQREEHDGSIPFFPEIHV